MNETPSVVIVDDDKSNLLVLEKILGEDYAVSVTKQSERALELARRVRPWLVLLDINMPGKNGCELLAEMKGDNTLRHIPVIFITGLDNPEDEARGFALGAVDYIRKPFHAVVVKARINSQMRIVQQMRMIELLSKTDPLTGVPNRRYFDERLQVEWERAARERQDLGVLMIDADYFKRYNDAFGHKAGDELLVALARTFQQTLKRKVDFVARVGGEEFSVILPHTSPEGAEHVAGLILAGVGRLAMPNPGSEVSPCVTVSIGAGSVVPGEADEAAVFVDRCDQALYRAKKDGRNRVCLL